MSEIICEVDVHSGFSPTGEKVVRCRNCVNCEQGYSDGAMFDATVCWAWDNGHDYPHFTSPNGYCYRGERRDA